MRLSIDTSDFFRPNIIHVSDKSISIDRFGRKTFPTRQSLSFEFPTSFVDEPILIFGTGLFDKVWDL